MFRFENDIFLWLLMGVPVLLLMFGLTQNWKKRALLKFSERTLTKSLIPLKSTGKPILKVVLFSLAYICLILGIANPQFGTKLEEIKREGVDLMICLDLSNSMKAEDLTPNRLDRAKRAIAQMIDNLHSDRIGIIVFGGQAYVQLPITTDYAAAKLFLSSITTDIIPTQGTAIGAAIELAIASFDEEATTNKSIIVITDGENHEDDAIEMATTASDLGIIVHTIGMGSTNGAPIPIYKGSKQIGYKKDAEGNSIVTKLNEPMLQEIAAAGDGIYLRASNAEVGLEYLLNEIGKMEKSEFGTQMFTDYEDRFQYCIGLALLLLFAESLISDRKSLWLENLKLFETKK